MRLALDKTYTRLAPKHAVVQIKPGHWAQI